MLRPAVAVALAGILAIAVAPKTAHGLVVALVQVANTTANPVPIEDVRGSASQILELQCQTNGGGFAACSQDYPFTSPSSPPFTVPTGQSFVITQIEAVCSGGGTEFLTMQYALSTTGSVTITTNREYNFPCNSTTAEFNLQPGLVVVNTDSSIGILNNIGISASKATEQPTYIRGYLNAN
jgi:hypothetical protein